jgi:hypothetical protein
MDSDYPFGIFKLFSNNTIRNFDTLSKFTSELKKINETEKHVVPWINMRRIFTSNSIPVI